MIFKCDHEHGGGRKTCCPHGCNDEWAPIGDPESVTAPLDPFAPLREWLALWMETNRTAALSLPPAPHVTLLARLLREHEERGKDTARLDWLEADGERLESAFGATVRYEENGDLRAIIDAVRSPHQEPTDR